MIRRPPRSTRTDTLFPYPTLFRSALDRLHRGFDVDHHAALEPARLVRADPDHLDRIAGGVLADQRHHLGGADVESDDECLVAFAVHDGKPGMGNGEWGMGRGGNRGAVSGKRWKATAGAAGPALCASALPDPPFPFPCHSS